MGIAEIGISDFDGPFRPANAYERLKAIFWGGQGVRSVKGRRRESPKSPRAKGCRRTVRWAVLALVLVSAIRPAGAVAYYFALDSAVQLQGQDWSPIQFVLNDNGAYSDAQSFGANISFKSLHRKPDGVWLFSLGEPAQLDSMTDALPRDVLFLDVFSIGKYLDGAAAGIPAYAGIDALFLIGADPVVSFDVPTNLGGVEYSPSDLVRFTGTIPSLYWNAQVAGVPPYANLVGADVDPTTGRLVVTFDIPVMLGGTEYRPGQLVAWTGSGFTSFSLDPGWPLSAQLRDFSFLPGAGRTPGDAAGETPLQVSRNAATGDISLTWGSSCGASDTDYEIYQGTLNGTPGFYNHAAVFCSTAGATSTTLAGPPGSVYWLIVPRNALAEGSYGKTSGGAQRPPGSGECAPQEIGACP